MKTLYKPVVVLTVLAICLDFFPGCRSHQREIVDVPPPPPLGTQLNAINQIHQTNADAAKFIVYIHEFQLNERFDQTGQTGWRLNEYGEDHLRQIAAHLKHGIPYPVVVERSESSIKPGTKFEYPVHFNQELDESRRQLVVTALHDMGVINADKLVVVGPSFAEGLPAQSAASAYQRTFNNSGSGNNSGSSGNRR